MWGWVNTGTYRYIFSGLFTSINPSYELGFTLTHPHVGPNDLHRISGEAAITLIITFLCANGHFMGQEYIVKDFGPGPLGFGSALADFFFRRRDLQGRNKTSPERGPPKPWLNSQ